MSNESLINTANPKKLTIASSELVNVPKEFILNIKRKRHWKYEHRYNYPQYDSVIRFFCLNFNFRTELSVPKMNAQFHLPLTGP